MNRDFGRRRLKARALHIVFASTFVCAVGSLMRAFTQDDHVYIRRAIEKCGPLCKAGEGVFTPSLFFNHRSTPVSCFNIFSSSVFMQRGHGYFSAPRRIPDEFLAEFSLNGRVKVTSRYFDQKYLTKTALQATWTTSLVDHFITLARVGELNGTYGASETNHLRSALSKVPQVVGGRVLVIGSEIPWVEACVLEARAKEVVTLEYGKIYAEHSQMSTLTPGEFQSAYLSGRLGLFDVIVTFSSVEHSGLGRYGDALNPWGDVLEIARAHCVTRMGGALVIAVMNGVDRIEFNAHRVYGEVRWPYLVTNWQQKHKEKYGGQVVHVFEKQ